MTGEQKIQTILDLLKEDVRVGIAYIPNEDGILTHQFLYVECGDQRASSNPEQLSVPLMPVVPKNASVN